MSWAKGVWAGLGFETGGELIFGIGQQMGIMFSIEDMVTSPKRTRWMTFQQKSATIGAGAGGSMGTNFIIGLNAATANDFEGASDATFDFSLDFGIGGLAKYVRTLPEMIEMAAIARKFDRNLMRVAEGLKKYEADAYLFKSATENVLKNHANFRDAFRGQAPIIGFPLPLGSYGLRLSVKAKAEETEVTSWGVMEVKPKR